MRNIILTSLFILFSTNIFSQENYYFGIKEDKFKHLSCGYGIGFAANCIGYEISKNKTVGFISGIALSTLAGHLKEVNDRHNGKIYSKSDLKATILGGIVGSVTIRIGLWNSRHRKTLTMQELVNYEIE